ncbi:MAG: hypothetical protein ACE5RN_06450 [Nitrosopumilaceae archaeon]
MIISSIPNIYAAQTVNIYTEKKIYSYGDLFSFTIEVSEITGEFATMYIIDESKKRSSPIPIAITELKTVVTSPYPFEETVYPLGKYTIEIEYSGIIDILEFELIDSGNIVIPFWIREYSKYWYNGSISEKEFANGIEFLIKENIIVIPNAENQKNVGEVRIPKWIKISTGWWIDGKISDQEYVKSLEYLIKEGIISV